MDIINKIIYPVFDEICDVIEHPESLIKAPETVLFGLNGVFNSLGLVSFIIALEERIADETGIILTLANEKAMSYNNSPFRTVATVATYIATLIEEEKNG